MMTLIEKAHAKVNLSLAITGKLPNGYHTLQSVMAPLELADTLTFEIQPSSNQAIPEVQTHTYFLQNFASPTSLLSSEENICTKTVRTFFRHPKIQELCPRFPSKIEIHIEKKIPMGGGMGGGSSNAAATLRALSRFLNLENEDLLHSIAAKIGADVPYLLQFQPCLCEGIGEVLTPLSWAYEWSQKHIVLFCPSFGVSTPWAYQQLDTLPPSIRPQNDLIDFNNLSSVLTFGFNDFETVVFSQYPFLQQIYQAMAAEKATYIRMSGSGSTLFAVCENPLKAAQIEESIGKLLTREFKNQGCYSIRTTGSRKGATGPHQEIQHEHHRN